MANITRLMSNDSPDVDNPPQYNLSMNWGDILTIGAGSNDASYRTRVVTQTGQTQLWDSTGNSSFGQNQDDGGRQLTGDIFDSTSFPVSVSSVRVQKLDNGTWQTCARYLVSMSAPAGSSTISFNQSSRAAGSTASFNWTNAVNNDPPLSFNTTTSRFTPSSGTDTLTGGSGTQSLTVNTVTASDGAWGGGGTLRASRSDGYTLDTEAQGAIVLYNNADAGTASTSLTSDNQTTGDFELTLTTSGDSVGVTNYRFLDGTTSGTIIQNFSTDNTITLDGTYRGRLLTGQVRKQSIFNSTVYSTAFSSDGITVSQIAADTTFTATSSFINWDAVGFSTTLTGVQIGDEVRAVLTSNTGILFENFTTVTSTTFSLLCNNSTVNSTNLPYGTATSVTIQVRRPTSAGGDGNTSNATTFTVTRNYREGPFTSVAVTTPSGASATIGAQAYNAYDIGQSEQVRVTGSGVISGATYIGRIVSGTTQGGATLGIVYNQTASGTAPNAATTAGGCNFSQLPTPGNSCTYRIVCVIPTNLGGDGTTEHECTNLSVYVPGNETEWTITRSNYVSPDTSVSSSTSATAVDVDLRSYQFGASSTSETISYTGGDAVTQYRILEVVGSVEVDTNTGASGTLTIDNANLPTTGNNKVYWLQARVETVNDGTGTWVNTDDTQYSGLEYLYQLTRETLATPTAGTLSAYRNNANGAEIVPSLALTWNGGTGEVEYAFSTTNTTPTNWTGTGYVDNGNSSLSRVTGPGTARSVTALYMGVRQKSVIDGTTTTPSYSSNTGGPFYNELFGSTDIEIAYDGTVYLPGNGQTPILVPSTDNTNNAVVSGFSKQAYTETSIDANSVGEGGSSNLQTVTNYSSFEITTDSANTNVGAAGTLVASDAANSAGNPSLVISNPGEMPASGDPTLEYTLYEYIFTARGGRGTKVATIPAIENQISIRKRAEVDEDITVTVPKKNLTPTDGSQIITIADGNGTTEYRIRVTGSTDANSDGSPPTTGTTVGTRTGNGTITISSANLPAEGDTVSYKVQFREAGTSDPYDDCTGTNSTFTIGRIQNFTITDGAPNTNRQVNTDYDSTLITVNGISGTETVTVRQNSTNGAVLWAKSSVNGGTFDNSDKSITNGQTLQIRFTTSSADNTSRTIRVTFTGSGHEELWTLTTGASTGTGAGTGAGTGTGDYGLQINNSSGNTLIDQNSRVARYVDNGSVTLAGGGTTSSAISVTGLTNSDEWTIVVVVALTGNSAGQASKFSVNKGTGSFTVTNNTEEQEPSSGDNQRLFHWWAFRSG